MCLSYPGRVVALDGQRALVETTGRRRHASLLLVPDTAVGDWVIVGAGSVLRRLSPAEADAITAELDIATRPSVVTAQPQGGRP